MEKELIVHLARILNSHQNYNGKHTIPLPSIGPSHLRPELMDYYWEASHEYEMQEIERAVKKIQLDMSKRGLYLTQQWRNIWLGQHAFQHSSQGLACSIN